MITVAIAEVFFFVEFSRSSDYTGGENGFAGRTDAVADSSAVSILHFDSTWGLYGYLAFLVFRWAGDRAPHRAFAGRRGLACGFRDNPLRAAAVAQHPGLQLTAFVIGRGYAGSPAGLLGVPAGVHAARRVHVRHLGQLVKQTAKIGRRRPLCRPAGSARRSGSISSADFFQNTLPSGFDLEAVARHRVRWFS